MKCTYSCNSPDHKIARRQFMAGVASAAAGGALGSMGFFTRPLAAAQLHKGYALLDSGKRASGIQELRSLIQHHPQSPESQQARHKLDGMGVRISPR